MRVVYISLFLIALTFQSCFIADTIFEPEPEQQLLPLEMVLKDSISSYINRTKKNDDIYLNYDYLKHKVIVPKTIAERDSWKRKKGASVSQAEVNRKIIYYDSIIKVEGLHKKITKYHTFSLRGKNDSLADVSKINFILSDQLSVVDIEPFYSLRLSKEEEKAFAHYYYKTPILSAYTYAESEVKSKELYGYFETHLNQLETTAEREYFLKHMIFVFEQVIENKEFDAQLICQEIATKYLQTEKRDIEGYKPIDFSVLYEVNNEEDVKKYYFFHTFEYQNNSKTEKMSLYMKFSPYYQIEQIFETEQKYDPIKP